MFVSFDWRMVNMVVFRETRFSSEVSSEERGMACESDPGVFFRDVGTFRMKLDRSTPTGLFPSTRGMYLNFDVDGFSTTE